MTAKELQLGSVSRETERTLLLLVLLIAGGLRALGWRSLPVSATEVEAVARPWLGVALPLLGLLTTLALFRLLRRWMNLPTALVAAGLYGVTGWAVVPPAETWPEQIATLCLLLVASTALDIAERRQPAGSWRLGVGLGLAAIFSGQAWVWLAGLLAWLPTVSRRLRGMGWARLVAEVTGGALLVFALVSGALHLSPWSWRTLPDGDRILAGLHGESLAAPFTRHEGASQAALDAWVGFEMAEADLRPSESGIEREAAVQTLVFQRLAEAPGSHLRTFARRALAIAGGWPGLASPALRVPVLPWPVLALAAWLGLVALLPSWRRYGPLLLGAGAPLLQSVVCGATLASLVLGLPFLATLAGYGLQRLAVGRGSPATWILGSLVLSAAWALHLVVAGWS